MDSRIRTGSSFSESTHIDLVVDRRAPAALRIYDVSGRLVTTLMDREVSAGAHRVSWNGLDAAGRRVSSGAYFYELDGATQTRKVIVLR
jgi:flagellar hook assembly protein FlgD